MTRFCLGVSVYFPTSPSTPFEVLPIVQGCIMNPASRRCKLSIVVPQLAQTRPVMTPPHPRNTSQIHARNPSKNDILAQFQEVEDDFEVVLEDDPIDPRTHNASNDGDYFIDDDFKTLRLGSNDVETLKTGSKPSLSPMHNLLLYSEDNKDSDPFNQDFMDFQEEKFDRHNLAFNLKTSLPKPTLPEEVRLSPATMSTLSPKSRIRSKSLSEFSEETNDTDVTSQLNEDDFEDVDNIFGNEESGIYSSGGGRTYQTKETSKINAQRANEHLIRKQRQLQNDAELEERELYKKYARLQSQVNHDEINTLKLKDFKTFHRNRLNQNSLDLDALENEKTINYEYTRDDFENFEEGFDLSSPIKFDTRLQNVATNSRDFHQIEGLSTKGHRMSSKMSMPNFTQFENTTAQPNTFRANNIKKYKSSMDLGGGNVSEHPFFNNNNKIIKKLDRIPSFYNKDMLKEVPDENQKLNEDIELQKQQLLNKYMEITEKQHQLNGTSPKKTNKSLSFMKQQRSSPKKGRKIGLVRYLNDNSIPMTTSKSSSSRTAMHFNPVSKNWEGNDIDLMKFEALTSSVLKLPNSKSSRPSLITVLDFKSKDRKIQGNMVYDSENLKWVNLDKGEEEDDVQVFKNVPDLILENDSHDHHRRLHSSHGRTPSPHKMFDRGVSTFTQRTTSTNSTNSEENHKLAVSNQEGSEFLLLEKIMERFYKEEAKISKKTKNWFNSNEVYLVGHRHSAPFNNDYFWEIRKMVIDTDDDQ